jgi:hypothetical protein
MAAQDPVKVLGEGSKSLQIHSFFAEGFVSQGQVEGALDGVRLSLK